MKKIISILFAIFVTLYLLTGCSSCGHRKAIVEPVEGDWETLDCGDMPAV